MTSAKSDKSMGSMGLSVLNHKFPDYSVIAYRFVLTIFKKSIFGPHPLSLIYKIIKLATSQRHLANVLNILNADTNIHRNRLNVSVCWSYIFITCTTIGYLQIVFSFVIILLFLNSQYVNCFTSWNKIVITVWCVLFNVSIYFKYDCLT